MTDLYHLLWAAGLYWLCCFGIGLGLWHAIEVTARANSRDREGGAR